MAADPCLQSGVRRSGHFSGKQRSVLIDFGFLLFLSSCIAGCQSVEVPSRASEDRIRADTQAATAVVPASQGSRWIQRVSAEPRRFNARKGEGVAFRFALEQSGDVQIRVETENGVVVRTIALGLQNVGRVRTGWDGKNNDGEVVASGVYRFVIELRPSSDQLGEYPADRGNEGEEVLVRELVFDRGNGVVRFNVPQDARVRVQSRLERYPLLSTLVDWEPMLEGTHEVPFDVENVAGVFDLSDESSLRVRIDAYALPSNVILVGDEEGGVPRRAESIAEIPGKPRYSHAVHSPDRCRQPKIRVEFPNAADRDESGVARIRGKESVRVTIDPADEEFLLSGSYELMFYSDLVFLFEEEEGTNPFNYILDASQLNPGLHHLTVNLITYNDHAAAETVPFWVE